MDLQRFQYLGFPKNHKIISLSERSLGKKSTNHWRFKKDLNVNDCKQIDAAVFLEELDFQWLFIYQKQKCHLDVELKFNKVTPMRLLKLSILHIFPNVIS